VHRCLVVDPAERYPQRDSNGRVLVHHDVGPDPLHDGTQELVAGHRFMPGLDVPMRQERLGAHLRAPPNATLSHNLVKRRGGDSEFLGGGLATLSVVQGI
jgi:hypothetical protein